MKRVLLKLSGEAVSYTHLDVYKRQMESMGFQNPKVAVLAANEMVDPKIPATSDAAALVEMAKEGAFPPCIIEGPLSFDIAFDAHAAAHKGIESKVCLLYTSRCV